MKRYLPLLGILVILTACGSAGAGAASDPPSVAIPSAAATYNQPPRCFLFNLMTTIGLSSSEQGQFVTDKAEADPRLQSLISQAQFADTNGAAASAIGAA